MKIPVMATDPRLGPAGAPNSVTLCIRPDRMCSIK
jgi:hypothetical protein